MKNTDVIKQLKELGLTEHESTIYLAVLKNDEASAGEVLDEVQLHREQVYRALKKLVDEGFLTEFEKNKRSYFSAVNPDIFVQRAQSKIKIAESLQPILKKLHQENPPTIRVFKGEDCFKIMFEDILSTVKKNGEYLVLGGAGDSFYHLTKNYFSHYQKILKKRKIKVRIVSHKSVKHKEELSAGEKISVRQIEGQLGGPAATVIYKNKVAIEVFDPQNPAVILIENPLVADSYRKTFESLWQIAKPFDGNK